MGRGRAIPELGALILWLKESALGKGSRARAGGLLLRSEGVTTLRYASVQVSGPQPTSPAGLQAMSILLGARSNFTSEYALVSSC